MAALKADGVGATQRSETLPGCVGEEENSRQEEPSEASSQVEQDTALHHHKAQAHTGGEGKKVAMVFVDAAQMKEKVRQALVKKTYNVNDFYKTKGFFQWVARSSPFEQVTLGVIAFNALWISIDTDNNSSATMMDADTIYVIMDNSFCGYFTVELFVRFMAFKWKRNCLKDGWFVFDSLLVGSAILETWIMTLVMVLTNSSSGGLGNASMLRLFRLMRLSRMARMARLLRAMPELLILIKGMVAAMRSVVFTLLLLMIIMYIFAIAFTQLTKDSDLGNTYFPGIPGSMRSLLCYGTFYDNTGELWHALVAAGPVYWILFLVYVLLGSLTVMNMLIGVLCEVVSAVAATEKEEMMVSFVKGKMQELLQKSGIDENNDGLISKGEFMSILENAEATRALAEVGVDPVGLVDFSDFIFEDDVDGGKKEKSLSFPDFMEVILELRGSNNATVKDIVDLRKFIRNSNREVQMRIGRLEGSEREAQLRRDASKGATTGGASPRSRPPNAPRSREHSPSKAPAAPADAGAGPTVVPSQVPPAVLPPAPVARGAPDDPSNWRGAPMPAAASPWGPGAQAGPPGPISPSAAAVVSKTTRLPQLPGVQGAGIIPALEAWGGPDKVRQWLSNCERELLTRQAELQSFLQVSEASPLAASGRSPSGGFGTFGAASPTACRQLPFGAAQGVESPAGWALRAAGQDTGSGQVPDWVNQRFTTLNHNWDGARSSVARVNDLVRVLLHDIRDIREMRNSLA